jgi:hypothetical protein
MSNVALTKKRSDQQSLISHTISAFELFRTQIKSTVSHLSLDSSIISDLLSPFVQFEENQVVLLWRSSRDGLEARYFHSRCDGPAHTLTSATSGFLSLNVQISVHSLKNN